MTHAKNAPRVRSKSRKTRASPPIPPPQPSARRPASNAWLPAWTIWSAGCATSYATASGSSPGLPPGRRKPPRAWSTRSFPASPRGCGTCKASRPPGRTGPAWCWPSLGSCSSSSTPSATLTHCPRRNRRMSVPPSACPRIRTKCSPPGNA